MNTSDPPSGGDHASRLEQEKRLAAATPTSAPDLAESPGTPAGTPRQTLDDVLLNGEEPTDEFLEAWNAEQNAPGVSDEELARQALQAPGEDADPDTPE